MKEYRKDDLTVLWDAEKCVHSAICANGLPEVFKPKDRPWVQMDNASKDKIIKVIKKCPSGALGFYIGKKESIMSENETTNVEVKKNGPLLVSGNLTVRDPEGKEEQKTRMTAFCRCGASANKPYCDGAHNEIKFEG